eukprot:TRINITY_DN88204_c0_g1_i1.p1 TRINITY_DN88204_c0_g1~~TRINITY_DN88204_c0_g1_i1.p1  ORF type:complete len:663 (-),score=120.02 TRINITY_DN88204_c0_g1_i1:20-1972(-)
MPSAATSSGSSRQSTRADVEAAAWGKKIKGRVHPATSTGENRASGASYSAGKPAPNTKKKSDEGSSGTPTGSASKGSNQNVSQIRDDLPEGDKESSSECVGQAAQSPEEVPWAPEQVDKMLRIMTVLMPLKHVATCCLLLPAQFSECSEDYFCLPQLSLCCMCLDVVIFTGHLLLGLFEAAYRRDLPINNFWLVLVSWSVWNLMSHPFLRETVVDILVVWPQEIHLLINVANVIVCSSTAMIVPSWRHLATLVIGEFALSLAFSAAEVLSSFLEDLDRKAWIDAAAVRLDLVIFNIAILIIGSTLVFGSMTAEKDWKLAGCELESGTIHSQAIEDDLERRKRAVLTALCDTVLTTNANFAITSSNEAADKMFKRPMLHEIFTDYLKDQAEKDKFVASMKKQFPPDDSVSDGPKRLRVGIRDATGKVFEADVVVSDASTDSRTGKVSKLMVGMHLRTDYRTLALVEGMKQRSRATGTAAAGGAGGGTAGGGAEQSSDSTKTGQGDDKNGVSDLLLPRAGGQAGTGAANNGGGGGKENGRAGTEEQQRQWQKEFSHELLSVFTDLLRAPPDRAAENSRGQDRDLAAPASPPSVPRILLHRANCETFRRRGGAAALPAGSSLSAALGVGGRPGERPGDLRRLSPPEPTVTGSG